MKKLWFKRKTYGWGWYPCSWQGWLAVIGYVVFSLILAFNVDENVTGAALIFRYILPIIIMTVGLILLAYKTGEAPRWQWGEPKTNSQENVKKEQNDK